MNIQQALNVSDRTISFRDAEVLLSAALDRDRAWLLAHQDQELTPEQSGRFQTFLERREANEPVAYIIGYKEFYGRRFKTDARALIPRPETEGLIERALAFLKGQKVANILELGTGSGNIALTLALELNEASILATDVSAEALSLAAENREILHAPHLTFLEASLFQHPELKKRAPYDLIVANLPYVSTTWQHDPAAQPDVVFYEPDVALFGGGDGLDLYREFFRDAPQFLAPQGRIIIEYGEDQTADLLPLAKQAFPQKQCTVHKDYAGLDRLLEIA